MCVSVHYCLFCVFFPPAISLMLAARTWVCDPCLDQSRFAIFHLLVSPRSWHIAPVWLLFTSPSLLQCCSMFPSFQWRPCNSCHWPISGSVAGFWLFQNLIIFHNKTHSYVRNLFLFQSLVLCGLQTFSVGLIFPLGMRNSLLFVCMMEVPLGSSEIAFCLKTSNQEITDSLISRVQPYQNPTPELFKTDFYSKHIWEQFPVCFYFRKPFLCLIERL